MKTDMPLTEESRKIKVAVLPRPPKDVKGTGLPLGFLVELACKTMYFGGVMSLSALSEELALPVSVTDDVMEFMKKERLAEVKKGADVRASYIYALTDFGRERTREYILVSGYVGPAPVTLEEYTRVARKQTIRKMPVSRETMRLAFEKVVLAPGLLDRLGPAVNSGRSIFLYGPSGNGKTFIAERLAKVLHGSVFIPHALYVDNQVVRIYDPVNHKKIDLGGKLDPVQAILNGRTEYDRRWVLCERPVVVAGGELTLAMLDLSFDQISKFYEAPLQLKANGGSFSSTISGASWSDRSTCSTDGSFRWKGAGITSPCKTGKNSRSPSTKSSFFRRTSNPGNWPMRHSSVGLGTRSRSITCERRNTRRSAARYAIDWDSNIGRR
ncbi:MAG TPA: hypothetical protein VLB09_06050 [Nitrospiria bacterium]|nr:hypothetical protein [Nitrospiria bacterium]